MAVSGMASEKDALEIVSKYKAVFTQSPAAGCPDRMRTPSNLASFGPLLGNGNVAVTISGQPDVQHFWFSKNDFWRIKSRDDQGYATGIGHMDVNIPELKGATYHIEQDLYTAETKAVFTKAL